MLIRMYHTKHESSLRFIQFSLTQWYVAHIYHATKSRFKNNQKRKIFCNETPLCPKNGGTYFIQGDFENIRAGGTSRILLSLHYSLTDALYH